MRFSIRGIMLLMLVICALLAFLVKDLMEAREEQAIVDRLNEVWATLTYVHETGENPEQLPGNALFRTLFGDLYQARLYEAQVVGPIGEETMVLLPNLRHLEILQIGPEKLSDRSVDALARIPRLRRLSFAETEMTPKQLRRIGKSGSIRALTLDSKSSTDAHLAELQHFEKLTDVCLWQTEATDTGIESLFAIPDLKSLVIITAPNVTDQSISQLGERTNLDELVLTGIQFTDRSFTSIAHLNSLRELRIGNWAGSQDITSDGIRQLRQLTGLHTLELDGLAINDRCMSAIAQLPNLEQLTLTATSVTDAGIVPLKGSPALTQILQSNNPITPQGMQAIGFSHVPSKAYAGIYERQRPTKPSTP
ncbi:hypothetical protein C5Y93_09825 [Blastopirellula marina]|uniref:Leucine Rich repeats (2 copies) n=1 Tax=Blastopirellula marina TaxID=124 RepID=A0A2S8GPB7_9BACT|nr:hypothetical protein C5Y93_09825 [Blastopirellula marina]